MIDIIGDVFGPSNRNRPQRCTHEDVVKMEQEMSLQFFQGREGVALSLRSGTWGPVTQWEILLFLVLVIFLFLLPCPNLSDTLPKASLLFSLSLCPFEASWEDAWASVSQTGGYDSVLPLIWWCFNYLLLKNKSPHETVIWAEFGRNSLSPLYLMSAGEAQRLEPGVIWSRLS